MKNLDYDFKRIKLKDKKVKLNNIKFGNNDNKSLYIDSFNINDLLNDKNNTKSYTKESNKIIEYWFKKIVKSNKQVIINEKNSNYFMVNELDFLLSAYKITDKEKQYKFIYDKVCDELDKEFINLNICDFKNNKCVSRRDLECRGCKNPLIYGCCYTHGRVCPNLKNNSCSIKCIACKLFTCRYLCKEKIKYKVNDFLGLKLFFNFKQKDIIYNKLFTDEDEIIKLLLKKM